MSEAHFPVPRHQWLAGPLPKDVATSLDRLARSPDVRYVAVMPDVHLAHEVSTGVVVATQRLLYPHAVGSDIGCGMAALRFHGCADVLADEQSAARLMAALYRAIPTIRHSRRTGKEKLPESLTDSPLSAPALEKLKARNGRVEFATLGRGNHFLEFQADDEGALWLMLHSGSRALGQAVNEHHIGSAAGGATELPFLDADSAAGQAYLADVEWACRYADDSRREMVKTVTALVGDVLGVEAGAKSLVCCNHNHVRRERHFDAELWVHRKGAISARADEPGIIPGSMGTFSFHVRGRGHEAALQSSSHGAGRLFSRTQALRTIRRADFERQMKSVWFNHRLADKLRDEAPSAYKDIQAVMRAQRELTCIVRRLRPVLCYKGV